MVSVSKPEGRAMPDHIHRVLSAPSKYSISMVGYLKCKSAIHIHRNVSWFYRKTVIGYCVSTICLDEVALFSGFPKENFAIHNESAFYGYFLNLHKTILTSPKPIRIIADGSGTGSDAFMSPLIPSSNVPNCPSMNDAVMEAVPVCNRFFESIPFTLITEDLKNEVAPDGYLILTYGLKVVYALCPSI